MCWIASLIVLGQCAASPRSDPSFQPDPAGDAEIRRIDPGANQPVDSPPHAKPDLLGYRIGNWQPAAPATDPWTGVWNSQGGFLRLEVHFVGLINPPGPQALIGDDYLPYLYGPNPAYGFIEFDADSDLSTGGDVSEVMWRYLANACRFGGKPPSTALANRFAVEGANLDGNLSTPPYVEKSGEEFHIALLGDRTEQVMVLSGDTDMLFEPNETWVVRGTFLHRAHVFERFSSAGGDGVYEPSVQLRWQHFSAQNLTIMTLVFPLTHAASAQMLGDPSVEPLDGNDKNQTSIEEGLADLVTSLQAIPINDPRRIHPTFPMVIGWETGSPGSCLLATDWEPTLLVGMAYPVLDGGGGLFAWTDVMPGARIGDFNGDGAVNGSDRTAIDQFIQSRDGGYQDFDGVINGSVVLANFGPNFSVFDVNYDGSVNGSDRLAVPFPGDLDVDFDVDTDDVGLFVQWMLSPFGQVPGPQGSQILPRADFNHNGRLDGGDIQDFVEAFFGYTY